MLDCCLTGADLSANVAACVSCMHWREWKTKNLSGYRKGQAGGLQTWTGSSTCSYSGSSRHQHAVQLGLRSGSRKSV